MKNFTKILFTSIFVLSIQFSFGQGWQKIEEGQVIEVEGVEISYVTSYIKEVKEQDVYSITATISNNGPDIQYLFQQARYVFKKEAKNSWVQFKFTNATGKGFSARSGNMYPKTFSMKFPIKCNPNQENDEYHSRIIGVGLNSGDYITKEYRVRVEKGKKPEVSCFMRSNF